MDRERHNVEVILKWGVAQRKNTLTTNCRLNSKDTDLIMLSVASKMGGKSHQPSDPLYE